VEITLPVMLKMMESKESKVWFCL